MYIHTPVIHSTRLLIGVLFGSGMEGAIERAKAYVAAGADALFPEALTKLTEYTAFISHFPNVPGMPCILNCACACVCACMRECVRMCCARHSPNSPSTFLSFRTSPTSPVCFLFLLCPCIHICEICMFVFAQQAHTVHVCVWCSISAYAYVWFYF